MSCYGLVRISTLGQIDNTSIDFQTDKIKGYSNLHDLELKETFVDVISGESSNRDGIDKITELIKQGECKTIIVWNISRLFRSMVLFANFYQLCNDYDCEIISVSEGIKSKSKTGEMLCSVLIGIASFERRVITERMMSGKYQLANQGKKCSGKIPYGYKRDRVGEFVVDEDESKVVKYIFKKVNLYSKMKHITKTKKTQRLLKLLKSRGFDYRGKDFRWWNIRDIINNRFYIGELKWADIKTNHIYPSLISKRLFNQIQMSY